MAHFDLHEQEQISNFRYFWKQGGKYLVGLLVAAVIAYLASSLWNAHVDSDAANAAQLYATFTDADTAENQEKTLALATELQNQYPKTEYAAMASMMAAKVAWKNNESATAARFLDWTITNAKDDGLVSISRLRLADIYIDEQKFDKAMQLMLQPHDPAFDPLYYSKRGDLYVAKGDLNKARDAYKEALKKAGQDSNMAQGVQLRLDVLGNN